MVRQNGRNHLFLCRPFVPTKAHALGDAGVRSYIRESWRETRYSIDQVARMQVRTFLPLDDLPRRVHIFHSDGDPCPSTLFDHPHALVARRDSDNKDAKVRRSRSNLPHQEIDVDLLDEFHAARVDVSRPQHAFVDLRGEHEKLRERNVEVLEAGVADVGVDHVLRERRAR